MCQILIVDDSRFARRSLGHLLKGMGHTVDEAAGGTEALAKFRSGNYDLVTLDLLMPQIDGLEVLARLRDIDPTVKVIVTTADIQNATRDEVMRFGQCTLINKPVDEQQLRSAIIQLLGKETVCN